MNTAPSGHGWLGRDRAVVASSARRVPRVVGSTAGPAAVPARRVPAEAFERLRRRTRSRNRPARRWRPTARRRAAGRRRRSSASAKYAIAASPTASPKRRAKAARKRLTAALSASTVQRSPGASWTSASARPIWASRNAPSRPGRSAGCRPTGSARSSPRTWSTTTPYPAPRSGRRAGAVATCDGPVQRLPARVAGRRAGRGGSGRGDLALHRSPDRRALGGPVTDKTVEFGGIALLRLRDGKIVAHRHVEEVFRLRQRVRPAS